MTQPTSPPISAFPIPRREPCTECDQPTGPKYFTVCDACGDCNAKKRTRTAEEFLAAIGQ